MDMGWASIIVSIISLVGVIITVSSGNKKTLSALQEQSRIDDVKLEARLKQYQAVTDTKIEELTRKVEKHNNLIERTYNLEARSGVLEEKIKVANNRIKDLEGKQ